MPVRTPSIRSSAALGRVLRSARERQGFTQAMLAEKADTTRWAVMNLEAGRETAALRMLFELTAALGLELTVREISHGSSPRSARPLGGVQGTGQSGSEDADRL